MDLRWEPNYRVIRLKSLWSVLIDDQVSSKAKCCNVADPKPKHPAEDWELEPSSIGRATRFINHSDNLPNVDLPTYHDDSEHAETPKWVNEHQIRCEEFHYGPHKYKFVTPCK